MPTSMYREVTDQRSSIAATIDAFTPILPSVQKAVLGKTLYLTGTGASYNACAATKLAFIKHAGFVPHILYAAELLTYPDALLGGAAVVVVSQSGESHETKQLCAKLSGTGATLIAITASGDSTLAKAADVVMPIRVGSEISSATKTYSATVLMLYMLAAGGMPYEALQADVAATLDIVEAEIERFTRLFYDDKFGYIAGIGALAPSASQAALMLKEKCFMAFEGMSVNELRHGTIEVVEQDVPVLLLASGMAGLEQARLHAGFLAGLGAKVAVVHDAKEAIGLPGVQELRIRYDGPEEFAHIAHGIFGQLLAERIARDKGYDVDGFRYIAKTVGSY